MRRRRGYTASKGEGTAFKNSTMTNVVYQGLNNIRTKMEALYPQPEFTVEDMAHSFIKPDDIEVCRRARQLGLATHSYYWRTRISTKVLLPSFGGKSFALDFISSSEDYAFPHYAGSWVANDHRALHALCEWADQVAAVRLQFAQVKATLSTLNKKCRTPREVRYFLPGLLTLIGASDQRGSITTELREVGAVDASDKPTWLLAECCKANETIASTQLIADPPQAQDASVNVSLSAVGEFEIPPFPGTWTID